MPRIDRAGRLVRSGLAVLAVALIAPACTTFYGLEPEPSTTSSGAGGAGGSVVFRPTQLLPIFDAAHLCGLVAECPTLGDSVLASTALPLAIPPLSDARNFSSCVEWLTAPLAPDMSATPRAGFDALRAMIVCMAATTTCVDAARCAFVEVIDAADARCDAETGSRCEDGAAIDCDARRALRCKSKGFAPGSECLVGGDGVAACAVGTCSMAAVSCDPASDPGPTEPSYLFACTPGGLRLGVDCRSAGLVCDASAADLAQRGCVGATGKANCSAFGEAACLGDRARVCSGVFTGEIDCAAMGRSCTYEGSTARCAPTGAACSPFDANVNLCDGATIHLCLDGAKVDFDCASIGATCVPTSGAVTGHCR